MPHPELLNRTPYVVDVLLASDEEGVPQFVPLVQAIWRIGPQGELAWQDEQPPIDMGGQWRGDPAKASMVREPQIALCKPATDVVLLGHAHAPAPGARDGFVGIRMGPVQKAARVFGERRFVKRLGTVAISEPEPFERIPIVHERAFGGWDRHHDNPARHQCEPRNPIGVGFRVTPLGDEEQLLPNFEDPNDLITSWGQTPAPAGFGFIAPDWLPRSQWAGTYDQAWQQQRKPLLPRDFDRRFFNAASPGLITPAPLRGDEEFVVMGCSEEGRLAGRLPGVPAPTCLVALRGRRRVMLPLSMDTVLIDMDARTLTLMWRGSVAVRNGIHDVLAMEVRPDGEAALHATGAALASSGR